MGKDRGKQQKSCYPPDAPLIRRRANAGRNCVHCELAGDKIVRLDTQTSLAGRGYGVADRHCTLFATLRQHWRLDRYSVDIKAMGQMEYRQFTRSAIDYVNGFRLILRPDIDVDWHMPNLADSPIKN